MVITKRRARFEVFLIFFSDLVDVGLFSAIHNLSMLDVLSPDFLRQQTHLLKHWSFNSFSKYLVYCIFHIPLKRKCFCWYVIRFSEGMLIIRHVLFRIGNERVKKLLANFRPLLPGFCCWKCIVLQRWNFLLLSWYYSFQNIRLKNRTNGTFCTAII